MTNNLQSIWYINASIVHVQVLTEYKVFNNHLKLSTILNFEFCTILSRRRVFCVGYSFCSVALDSANVFPGLDSVRMLHLRYAVC